LPDPRVVAMCLLSLRIGACGSVFLAIGCCKFCTSGQTIVQTPESAIEAVLNPNDLRAWRGQAMVQFAAKRWFKSHGGARTRRAPNGEAEAPQTAGRGNWPEAVPGPGTERKAISMTSKRGRRRSGKPIRSDNEPNSRKGSQMEREPLRRTLARNSQCNRLALKTPVGI
jgi:hypothetical protein